MIKTVQEFDPESFDKEVNKLLSQGYALHGPPAINTVAEMSVWEGETTSHAKTTFVQVLKKP